METKENKTIFLKILKDAIHGKKITIKREEIDENLNGILRLSRNHIVMPLIVDSIYNVYPDKIKNYKQRAITQTIRQASKTASFLLLYKRLSEEGLYPIVMKGIICRNLYPEPELRVSADEDLFIDASEVLKYHDFLLKLGFVTGTKQPLKEDYEIIYQNENNKLMLGVHKHLFSQKDSAFKELNKLFKTSEERSIVKIDGIDIHTLGSTDHILYMICHAYKHLVYSGIGIRQLCDMTLFAEKNGKDINWNKVYEKLKKEHLELFAEALLKICVEDLGMDLNKAGCSNIYLSSLSDKGPLLDDILSGGAYGASDENRLHSANITRSAVASSKGSTKDKELISSIFPPYVYMANRYEYLKKNKYLLPIAWTQRIYGFLRKSKKDVNPTNTMKIGKERIELLKKYKLV